jgi:hypothetical protein
LASATRAEENVAILTKKREVVRLQIEQREAPAKLMKENGTPKHSLEVKFKFKLVFEFVSKAWKHVLGMTFRVWRSDAAVARKRSKGLMMQFDAC